MIFSSQRISDMKDCKRRVDFDVIRIFACLTILMIHFNASVSGYDYSGQFLFNNGIVPNYYFDCIYLGEIGNSLFFILSGASLMLKPKKDLPGNPFQFWFKRAKSLYPAFWIAFVVATCVHFFRYKWISDAPLQSLLRSILGVDGYAMCRSWSEGDFYQVGEWYLGCILLCYLFWPLVVWIWKKIPALIFTGGVIAIYIVTVLISNGNDKLVIIRLCEMIAGGFFSQYLSTTKNWKLLGGSLLAAILSIYWKNDLKLHSITVSFVVCWAIFVWISGIVEYFPTVFSALSPYLKKVAGLTYPLFLVHHKLISIMASLFDLEYFPYRYTIVMFIAYLLISIFLACWLNRVTQKAVHTAEQAYKFTGALWNNWKEKIKVIPS